MKRLSFPAVLSRCAPLSACIAMIAATPAIAAAPATPMDKLPAQGLYRIDSVSRISSADGAQRTFQENGASGDTKVQLQAGGHVSARLYQGTAPVTRCVQSHTPPVALTVPGMTGCTAQSSRASKDGMVHVAVCNGMKITLTMNRLDRDNWDVVTQVTSAPGAPAPVGMDGLTPLLEHAAKHAPTAEQRAKATSQLAQLPAMQAQMQAQRRHTADSLQRAVAQAKTPEEKKTLEGARDQLNNNIPLPMQGSRHERWTRIGDACSGGGAL